MTKFPCDGVCVYPKASRIIVYSYCIQEGTFTYCYILFHLKMMSIWAREVSHQLRALADLPGDLGLVPSTHMVPHNSE